jgi:hypothetical protein
LRIRHQWKWRRKAREEAFTRRVFSYWRGVVIKVAEELELRAHAGHVLFQKHQLRNARKTMYAWLAWLLASLKKQSKRVLIMPFYSWLRSPPKQLPVPPARAFIAWVSYTSMTVEHRQGEARLLANIKSNAAAAARIRVMLQGSFRCWKRLCVASPTQFATALSTRKAPRLMSPKLAPSLSDTKIRDAAREWQNPTREQSHAHSETDSTLTSLLQLLLTPGKAHSHGRQHLPHSESRRRRASSERGRAGWSEKGREGGRIDDSYASQSGWAEDIEESVERLKIYSKTMTADSARRRGGGGGGPGGGGDLLAC